jgi:hypothetical protein
LEIGGMSILKVLIAMGTNVEVLFDREDKTYKPGDTILGKVIVESDEERNLKLIKGTHREKIEQFY